MVDYRNHLEAAKQKALAWTPESIGMSIFSLEYGVRDYIHAAINAVVGIYDDAIHAAECEGCAVKGVNHYTANMAVKWAANDPDDVPAYKAAIVAQQMHEMYQKGVDLGLITGPPPEGKGVGWDDYPHDNLPFHSVFNVDHNPGAAMAKEAQEENQFLKDQWAISREDVRRMFAVIDKQNELLTLLQSQRDAYKTRLDALMNEGLLVDKTKYRIEFVEETETEVRVRLIPIDHAA